ncbi:hypothetical protein GCM10023149_49100 [Mucilaginibacter gynuensis]|uniref:Uncharacterized protein n=1 Tax=Mucilaginibacter gynuensis TaxID=1302236 RepID=A0ABP8HG49_9SPHI
MDTVFFAVVIALVSAVIVLEVNKRQQAKRTSFFNSDTIPLLINAECKIHALIVAIEKYSKSKSSKDESEARYIQQQLRLITQRYESGEISLNSYNALLDKLIGTQPDQVMNY